MNSFFLFIIGLPALEIFIMIKIGGKIGALNTISLIFLYGDNWSLFCKIARYTNFKIGHDKSLSK